MLGLTEHSVNRSGHGLPALILALPLVLRACHREVLTTRAYRIAQAQPLNCLDLMKRLIKRILPSSLVPVAQRTNARIHQLRWKSYRAIDSWINTRSTPRLTRMPADEAACDCSRVLQCAIAYNKYGGYCVPLASSHRPAVQRILRGEVHEPNTIEFLISHCKDGDIVHAGTYFGDFLPALSNSCASGAKVWAFEPHPEHYRCALITLELNMLQHVNLLNAGLGDRQSSQVMVTTDESGRPLGGGSQIVSAGHAENRRATLPVQVVLIDDVVPQDRKVSIIQLDVELFERQALAGALKTIQRCLPVILVETMPEEEWLAANIWPLGYRVSGEVDGNKVLARD